MVGKNPFISLSFLLIIAFILSLVFGAITVFSLFNGDVTDYEETILFSIRLPRSLLAVFIGAALAIAGGVTQGLFRNSLADPSLIGITSGSALAVAFVIICFPLSHLAGLYALSFAAFLGGLLSCVFVIYLSSIVGFFSTTYLLIAGIAVNTLAMAVTGFLIYFSNDQQLRTLTFWTMGSLGGALWSTVIVAGSLITVGVIVLIKNARALNILLLGESEAYHLGVNTKKLKCLSIISVSLIVGACVSVSGIIGFVGLIVPHLVRILISPDHRLLIPSSALLGASLLLIADTVSRVILSPAELPVGVITSLIGGPFFLYLLLKQYPSKNIKSALYD